MLRRKSFLLSFGVLLLTNVLIGEERKPVSIEGGHYAINDQELFDRLSATLSRIENLEEKDIEVPAEREVRALKVVQADLKRVLEKGKPRGILIWFQKDRSLTEDDKKYVKDVVCVIDEFTAECAEIASAVADEGIRKELEEVRSTSQLYGTKFNQNDAIRAASAIRTMSRFRKNYTFPQNENLEEGVLIRVQRDYLLGISEEEIKERKLHSKTLLGNVTQYMSISADAYKAFVRRILEEAE